MLRRLEKNNLKRIIVLTKSFIFSLFKFLSSNNLGPNKSKPKSIKIPQIVK